MGFKILFHNTVSLNNIVQNILTVYKPPLKSGYRAKPINNPHQFLINVFLPDLNNFQSLLQHSRPGASIHFLDWGGGGGGGGQE